MKTYTLTFWRSNPQLKNGGYEMKRTVEARSIVSARKKAREIAEKPGYGGLRVLNVALADA